MEELTATLDRISQNMVHLNGALNAQIEQSRVLEARLLRLENPVQATVSNSLALPRTEEELQAIAKLPDSVKDLQVFEGNPIQYISWVHNVESILKDYEIVKHKPIYRAILKHVRQKIRGAADSALISYNIFDADWSDIKKCLSTHYADKRDIQSLENQLLTLHQGNAPIDRFYNRVNHQLSLIINKIKTEDFSTDGMTVLIENYRQRALDVFIRGLHQSVAQLVKVQKPNTLPEAYSACLELQNMNFRRGLYHNVEPSNNFSDQTINQIRYPNAGISHQPTGRNVYHPLQRLPERQFDKLVQRPMGYSVPPKNPFGNAPPRPTQPKPPMPMEVDPSLRSERVNYMNRPGPNIRRSDESSNIPRKAQRVFNIETQQEEEYNEQYEDQYDDQHDDRYNDQNNDSTQSDQLNEVAEVNFMTEASPEYLT